MSVYASETPGTHAAFSEAGAQPHVNPNKRHITSQLWKRNDTLAMKDGLHAPIKFITGDAYLGEWRANKPHGQGTLTYRSGNKIEGETLLPPLNLNLASVMPSEFVQYMQHYPINSVSRLRRRICRRSPPWIRNLLDQGQSGGLEDVLPRLVRA